MSSETYPRSPDGPWPGHDPADRARFAAYFRENALRTARVVALFDDEAQLALSPGGGGMTLAEQIQHIASSHNFTRGILADDAPDMSLFGAKPDVSTLAAATASLKAATDTVMAAAEAATDAKWAEVISPFGPGWELTRGEHAHLMVDHEIHHRGALHVYARMAGKTPPFLYEPVDRPWPKKPEA